MKKITHQNHILLNILLFIFLASCGMGADARKYPPNPELRVKKNIEEGRGFRLMDAVNKSGGTFDFAIILSVKFNNFFSINFT